MLDPDSREARLAYAYIYKILGFPIKYLMELLVLSEYYEYTDSLIQDDIEIYTSFLENSLASKWADILKPFRDKNKIFDQYSIERNTYSINIYSFKEENRMYHLEADQVFW